MYRESDAVTRALRDYLSDDIGEVLVDDEATFADGAGVHAALHAARRAAQAQALHRRHPAVHALPDREPDRVGVRAQGGAALGRLASSSTTPRRWCRSTSTRRAPRAAATSRPRRTNTNLEAADEIARQLRIRDIGGLIVIDFIDMESPKNQRDVEDRLRDAVKMDRARIQIGRLSRFGLLEMSRQRLRPSLGRVEPPRLPALHRHRQHPQRRIDDARHPAPHRRGSRARTSTAQVIAQVPVEVATYLINEKREWLRTLEDKGGVELMIVPNPNIQTPEYSIKRVRNDEIDLPENKVLCYKMPERPSVAEPTGTKQEKPQQEPAAVVPTAPATAAPVVVHVPAPAPTPAAAVAAPPAASASGRDSVDCSPATHRRAQSRQPRCATSRAVLIARTATAIVIATGARFAMAEEVAIVIASAAHTAGATRKVIAMADETAIGIVIVIATASRAQRGRASPRPADVPARAAPRA